MTRTPHPARPVASRRAGGIRATWCPSCKAPIIVGLDADQCAVLARADALPINAAGETVAVLAGRATYEIKPRANSFVIRRRNANSIRRRPAGKPAHELLAYDVVQEHRCPTGPADTFTLAPTVRPRTSHLDPAALPPY